MPIAAKTTAFLAASKAARNVRRAAIEAPFAAIEDILAEARAEAFALMRRWRAMEVSEPDGTVRGRLEEYNQTLGALERECAKAIEHVQAVRRIAAQFDSVDAAAQTRFVV